MIRGFRTAGESVAFLLKGCANGICAGGCVAGTDVDLFGGTGAGAVVIYAIGYVTGNTVVFFAGLAGFFRRIVVHDGSSFQSKNLERRLFFRNVLFARLRRFMQSDQGFSYHIPLNAEYITFSYQCG